MAPNAPAFVNIDRQLKQYYESLGRSDYVNDDGVGKFLAHCIKEDHDADNIDNELGQYAADCMYFPFDDDFPFDDEHKDADDGVKLQFMLDLITRFHRGQQPHHSADDVSEIMASTSTESVLDSEYQSVLARAELMNPCDAAAHFCEVANYWYSELLTRPFRAFSNHIDTLMLFISSDDTRTRRDAIRTMAFVAACPGLHQQMFNVGAPKKMIDILQTRTSDAISCEAALVALNHLCAQSATTKNRFAAVSSFCENKDSLRVIFRYANVLDDQCSIISNAMSVLAALCTDRRMSHSHSLCIYCNYPYNSLCSRDSGTVHS